MSVKRNKNKRGKTFLDNIPTSLLSDTNIEKRCKFNFSFFHHGNSFGQDFAQWNKVDGNSQLVKLMDKIKDYTSSSLKELEMKPYPGGTVLKFYSKYPAHSKLEKPKSVPTDVEWGVFRVDAKSRLVGFKITEETNSQYNLRYCSNTFYVVFLDELHEFYPTTKKNT